MNIGNNLNNTKDAISTRRLFEFPSGFCCYSHSSHEETIVLYNETFIKNEYMKGDIQLHDGDCLFDVGANIGLFTIYANMKYKNLTTFAFEPMVPTYEVLLTNLYLYNLVHVNTFQFGLSANNCTKDFFYFPNQPGNTTTRPECKIVQRRKMLKKHTESQIELAFERKLVSAPVKTLSSVIDEYHIQNIDLLKIDVEGAEQDVLAGIESHHWEIIKQIVLEVHDAETNLNSIKEILINHGFNHTTGTNSSDWVGNVNLYCIRNC